jgi:hypothetical protein
LPVNTATGREGIVQTQQELAERFSGLTAYLRSPARGLWTAPDGTLEPDDVIMVEVVTEGFEHAWWREYAGTLRKRFRQESLHIRAMPIEMLEEAEDG